VESECSLNLVVFAMPIPSCGLEQLCCLLINASFSWNVGDRYHRWRRYLCLVQRTPVWGWCCWQRDLLGV